MKKKPMALGTVWPVSASLLGEDGGRIGTCLDTPNAIAKALMERPDATHVVEALSHVRRPRSAYADRMAGWNVAESRFRPTGRG